MTDEREIFKQLEPPEGGAERFIQRLEQEARRSSVSMLRPTVVIVGFALVAITVYALLRIPEPAPPRLTDIYDAPEFDRLVGRPSDSLELRVRRNAQEMTLVELETSDPRVRIYKLN